MVSEPRWLAELTQFASNTFSVLSLVEKAVLAIAPAIALFAPFSPPWPSRPIVSSMIGVCQLVVIVGAFEFWRKAAIQHTRKILILSGVAIFVFLLFYSSLWGDYVVTFADAPEIQHIVGRDLKPELAALRNSNPTFFTDEELLNEWQRDPKSVWTSESLKRSRLLLVVTWLLFWSAVFSFVASFVAVQTQRNGC